MTDTKPKLFVLAAPSGAGKTTLVHALVQRNPALKFSISYTTRKRRVNEEDGRDYYFVNAREFHRLRKTGELLESARVFGNHYGTSRSQVEEHLENDYSVILEIDWQGAQQVRAAMPDAISVFILPPSVTELERRLRNRKTDSDRVIAKRLKAALSDMSHWREFTYAIVNDELDQAADELEMILEGRGESNRVGLPVTDAAVAQVLET